MLHFPECFKQWHQKKNPRSPFRQPAFSHMTTRIFMRAPVAGKAQHSGPVLQYKTRVKWGWSSGASCCAALFPVHCTAFQLLESMQTNTFIGVLSKDGMSST
eukprot:2399354-Rhodomonas_salina.1